MAREKGWQCRFPFHLQTQVGARRRTRAGRAPIPMRCNRHWPRSAPTAMRCSVPWSTGFGTRSWCRRARHRQQPSPWLRCAPRCCNVPTTSPGCATCWRHPSASARVPRGRRRRASLLGHAPDRLDSCSVAHRRAWTCKDAGGTRASTRSTDKPFSSTPPCLPPTPTLSAITCSRRCRPPSGSAGCRSSKRVDMPLGQVLYESGATLEPRLLPDHGHRLAAVRDGRRRLGRDRGRRQRGRGRHLAVHGRRVDAQPRGRAKRRPGLSPERAGDQGGVQPRRPGAAPAAALHAGADHADGADGGVQPPPLARPAAVPLAAAEPGPAAGQRAA